MAFYWLVESNKPGLPSDSLNVFIGFIGLWHICDDSTLLVCIEKHLS